MTVPPKGEAKEGAAVFRPAAPFGRGTPVYTLGRREFSVDASPDTSEHKNPRRALSKGSVAGEILGVVYWVMSSYTLRMAAPA